MPFRQYLEKGMMIALNYRTSASLISECHPHDIEKGLEAGFFAYLTKPIKFKEFMNVLDSSLAAAEKIKSAKELKA
jgi:AmiR/NasT family two-component response regulator